MLQPKEQGVSQRQLLDGGSLRRSVDFREWQELVLLRGLMLALVKPVRTRLLLVLPTL